MYLAVDATVFVVVTCSLICSAPECCNEHHPESIVAAMITGQQCQLAQHHPTTNVLLAACTNSTCYSANYRQPLSEVWILDCNGSDWRLGYSKLEPRWQLWHPNDPDCRGQANDDWCAGLHDVEACCGWSHNSASANSPTCHG